MDLDGNYTLIFINLLGGLGFFLYGLMAMSESLQRVAGKRMKSYLDHSTRNVFIGLLSGAIFTALVQSSGATTVLIIGLLNAGLINFRQATSLIIGSNIGTVITGFIIGINLSYYSLLFVALGMLLRIMGHNKIIKEYGRAIFGFGVLFFGMNLMGESMYPLKESIYFNSLLLSMENNILIGLFTGTFLTAIVHSGNVVVGILQQMFYKDVITLNQLIPVLLGTAIGTTVTAAIASINTGLEARKAAVFHFLFNVVGTVLFVILFISGIYLNSIEYFYDSFIGDWLYLDGKMKVAFLNAYFRIGYALAFIPLIGLFTNIIDKIVRPKGTDEEGIYRINLDLTLLGTPDLAYKNINKEIIHMVDLAKHSVDNALKVLNSTQKDLSQAVAKGERIEKTINSLKDEIRDYTLKVQDADYVEKNLFKDTFFVFDTIRSLERIGDYAQNIIRTIQYKKENDIFIPEFFYDKINDLGRTTVISIDHCQKIIETGEQEYIDSLEENRIKTEAIYKELKTINLKSFTYYDNISYINYVVKNIGDNFSKVQQNIDEIVSNYNYCTEYIDNKKND